MKRLTLLTILLVVVGLTAGFALELKPSFELTGSGQVTWGIDLDDFSTGFENIAVADLTLNLFAEDTEDTKKGEGDWYGSITLSDIELYATAASDSSDGTEDPAVWVVGDFIGVEASIVGMGGNLVIGVYGAPDTYLDFVEAIEADEDAEDDFIEDETATLGVGYDGFGTFVSYNVSEMLMLGFEVMSELNHLDNVDQAYAFALDVQVLLDAIEIDAGVNYGFAYVGNPNVMGAGVKVAYTSDALAAWVGFDAQVTGGFAFEVGAGVTATLAEGVTADLAVVYGDAFDNLDISFVFTEPGEAGLVDMLDASLTVYVFDLLGVAGVEYQVIFEAGYDMGKPYPHFGVTYTSANDPYTALEVFVHVDYELFEAAPTTLFVEWNSGDLLASALGEY